MVFVSDADDKSLVAHIKTDAHLPCERVHIFENIPCFGGGDVCRLIVLVIRHGVVGPCKLE